MSSRSGPNIPEVILAGLVAYACIVTYLSAATGISLQTISLTISKCSAVYLTEIHTLLVYSYYIIVLLLLYHL